MRFVLLALMLFSACDVFRAPGLPKTRLTQEEFIEVYVALAKANTPAEKERILKEHGTSQKELEAFIQAYTADVSSLSAAFDSALSRMSTSAEGPEGASIPRLLERR